MNNILLVKGGIKKTIIATAICKVLHKQYPNDRLIVISDFPEIFIGLSYVSEALKSTECSYFYEKYVSELQFRVFAHDPYQDTLFLNDTSHVIESWCKMYDLTWEGELPEIRLTTRELDFYQEQFKSDKPILVIQPNECNLELPYRYDWTKDIPVEVTQRIIVEFENTCVK